MSHFTAVNHKCILLFVIKIFVLLSFKERIIFYMRCFDTYFCELKQVQIMVYRQPVHLGPKWKYSTSALHTSRQWWTDLKHSNDYNWMECINMPYSQKCFNDKLNGTEYANQHLQTMVQRVRNPAYRQQHIQASLATSTKYKYI